MKKNVRSRAMIGIVMMSLIVSAAVAQSAPKGQDATQETQARGFWIDPSTRLMWAAKDSGKDTSYGSAVEYCRDLRLAGYSDWGLATLGDLQGIYDKTANALGLGGGKVPITLHVKGNLFLTGCQWAWGAYGQSGRTGKYWDSFNFDEGRSNDPVEVENRSFAFFMRALCVRGPQTP